MWVRVRVRLELGLDKSGSKVWKRWKTMIGCVEKERVCLGVMVSERKSVAN